MGGKQSRPALKAGKPGSGMSGKEKSKLNPKSQDMGEKDKYGSVNGSDTNLDMGDQATEEDTEGLFGNSGRDYQGIYNEYIRPCLAEFFMVTVFVFIGTITVASTKGDIASIALAHGLTIGLLIAGFGGVSGAHINPAVTLGVVLSGGVKPFLAIFYVIAQMAGAILGAALCRGVLGNTVYESINGGGHTVGADTSSIEAILCEAIVTMVLVATVLMTAVDSDGKNPNAPFAIGLAVLVGILAAATVSGASMNPARSFGPCFVLWPLKSIWKDFWIYIVGPVIGSAIAAAEYRVFFGRDDKRIFM